MTREELTRIICPAFMTSKCEEQVDCNYCKEKTNKWLEEYDKQIRAEVIEKLFSIINVRMSHLKDLAEEYERTNNQYQAHYHRGGLWELGIMRDELEQLKEQNK